MAFDLSFSPEFFVEAHDLEGYTPKIDRPTSVYQAILMMPSDTWDDLAWQVFGCHPEHLTAEMVLDKIRETDTCRDLRSPVEVYIDSQGYFSVDVYDREERDAA